MGKPPSPPARPPGSSAEIAPTEMPSRAAISAFLHRDGRRWLKVPNVVGVSVTGKRRGGAPTGELAVVFDVVAKLQDRAEIVRAGSRPVPATIEIDGYRLPTDVVEAWPEAHENSPTRSARADPVCGGLSVGNAAETGTLGAVVWHRPSGAPVALSNWHILSNGGQGGRTVQPGPKDDGDQDRNALGQVVAAVLDDDLDAAITTLGERRADGCIAGLETSVAATAAATEGMKVVKSGKASGVTYGIVTQEDKLIRIPYENLPQRHSLSVLVIEPDTQRPNEGAISEAGDSGSCWMLLGDDGAPTGTMVGLHVGGDGASMAYACGADQVFARLQIEPLGDRGSVLAALHPAAALDLARLYRVIARDGLALRSGPAVSFPRLDVEPFGRTVHVLLKRDDWFMVDLEGDGKADGFMFAAFLEPA